ncbi:MAG: hypothetical protein ACFB10_22655 [Salibacteraceae bacterium]
MLTFWLVVAVPLFGVSQEAPTTPQVPKESPLKKFTYGGGLGLQFGTVTIINLSPAIGYRVTDKILPGISFTYSYYSDTQLDVSATIYGGSVFARYYPLPQFFAHTEYEVLNGDWLAEQSRFNVRSFFIGGGYSYRIAPRVVFNLLGLWNLNDGTFSPYQNPVVRGGFQVGI